MTTTPKPPVLIHGTLFPACEAEDALRIGEIIRAAIERGKAMKDCESCHGSGYHTKMEVEAIDDRHTALTMESVRCPACSGSGKETRKVEG